MTPPGAADPPDPATGSAHRPDGPLGPAGRAAPAPRTDPVLVRRDRYYRLANLGQRIGYLLLGIAVVAFVAGFATGFPAAAVTTTIIGLVGACVVLPPAIIAGYAVKAAEREDREAGRLPGRKGGSGPSDTMR